MLVAVFLARKQIQRPVLATVIEPSESAVQLEELVLSLEQLEAPDVPGSVLLDVSK